VGRQVQVEEGSSRGLGAEAGLSPLAVAAVAGGSSAPPPSARMEAEADSSSKVVAEGVASPLSSAEAEEVQSPAGTVGAAKSAESIRGAVAVAAPRS